MRKGFTLVELSIVLVIIGLLIGGILVAQSMITTSKISAQLRQLGQFDAAVANFITKYNAIPGDFAGMVCSSGTCGNGRIDDWYSPGGGNGLIWSYGQEVADFWPQLGNAGFMQGSATFTANLPASGFQTKTSPLNSPATVINSAGGVIAATSKIINRGDESYAFYQLADYSALNSADNNIQTFTRPIITPSDALAIDAKIDDSNPSMGIVRATNSNGTSFYFASNDNNVCSIDWTGSHDTMKYRVQSNEKLCSIAVQIMSGSGGMPNRGSTY